MTSKSKPKPQKSSVSVFRETVLVYLGNPEAIGAMRRIGHRMFNELANLSQALPMCEVCSRAKVESALLDLQFLQSSLGVQIVNGVLDKPKNEVDQRLVESLTFWAHGLHEISASMRAWLAQQSKEASDQS